jgi:hypothetical protein
VTAWEVAARYVAALEGEEGQSGFLAQFRQTRKAAQELGAFWGEVNSRGWEEALKSRGLKDLAEGPPAAAALALAAHLGGPAGSLEAAAGRTALAQVLREGLPGRNGEGETPNAAQAVKSFLARAVAVRLSLDLGESLEAAAVAPGQLAANLKELSQAVEQAAGEAGPSSKDWPGLAGWQWTTQILVELREALNGRVKPGNAGGGHGGG